ncbi:MAG: hypothetical protein IPG50_15750 [Myxococcales bacterium]|nr:hypothetical protein [Myxococcales bacterium]
MLKHALMVALSLGVAGSAVGFGAATTTDRVACGEEKKGEQPKPKPKPPAATSVVACGEEKKEQQPTPNPKPKPPSQSVWLLG